MERLGSIIGIVLVLSILVGGALLVETSQRRSVPKPVQEFQSGMVGDLCPDLTRICELPLEKLLQFPATFNGTLVRTEGVLQIEFEGTSLYIDQDAFASRDQRASVWVSLGPEWNSYAPLSGAVVLVEGQFFGGKSQSDSYGGYGHMGSWYGEVEVASIEPKANLALELTLDPAALFAIAKSTSASSAAQLGR